MRLADPAPAEAVLRVLQQAAREGAEFSLAGEGGPLGVLTPVDRAVAERLAGAWGKPAAVAEDFRPRFARCDFDRGGWRALTLYGEDDTPRGGTTPALPVFGCGLRWTRGGASGRVTYLDVRATAPAEAADRFTTVVGAAAREDLSEMAQALARLGWLQYAALGEGEGAGVKFTASVDRSDAALALVAASAPPAAARFRALLDALHARAGYLAASAGDPARRRWRLYARPVVADLAATLRSLL